MILNCPNCGEAAEVNPDHIILSKKEVKAIYRIIEHEYLNRDDDEVIKIADKVTKFALGKS